MRYVNISALEPGMVLGRTIYNNKGEELLKAGVILTELYITHLTEGKAQFVWVDDGLPFQMPEARDVINQQTRKAAVQQIKNILLESKAAGRLVIEPQSLYNTVGGFTEQLLNNKNVIFNLVDLRTQDDYTFAHSVNVCVLTLMTGITLGYSKNQLAILGVGALLHDLGKVKIPDEILNKPGALTDEEFAIMKRHTVLGYEMIIEAENTSEINGLMALQHHENYDGSGYLQGLAGKEISDYAQIVAVADRFDAITADRVYRKPFPPVEAFEMCSAASNYLIKEPIVRAFMYNIAAYPARTVVELSNGMIGVTVDTPKGQSLFPLVKVFYDEKKRLLPNPIELPLYEKDGLFVVRVLQNQAP